MYVSKKTPKGEIAILPKAEYDALVEKAAEAEEDFGTARIVARARKQALDRPLLPMNVVERIAGGENPVRVLREWRDVTQVYLSNKTDISQGTYPTSRTGTGSARRRRFDGLRTC